MIKISPHLVVKIKSCHTNLISFFERITGLLDKKEEKDMIS